MLPSELQKASELSLGKVLGEEACLPFWDWGERWLRVGFPGLSKHPCQG